MKLLYPYNVLIDLSANCMLAQILFILIYIFIWRFLKIFHSTFYDRENHLFASGGKNLPPLISIDLTDPNYAPLKSRYTTRQEV